uniref:Uncharacterized protein n=1 Tax=Glossina palpalis gambiensis TaxID=67801 RepID=A0A1B0BM41_9MUSC
MHAGNVNLYLHRLNCLTSPYIEPFSDNRNFMIVVKSHIEKIEAKDQAISIVEPKTQTLNNNLTLECQQFQAELMHEKQADSQALLTQMPIMSQAVWQINVLYAGKTSNLQMQTRLLQPLSTEASHEMTGQRKKVYEFMNTAAPMNNKIEFIKDIVANTTLSHVLPSNAQIVESNVNSLGKAGSFCLAALSNAVASLLGVDGRAAITIAFNFLMYSHKPFQLLNTEILCFTDNNGRFRTSQPLKRVENTSSYSFANAFQKNRSQFYLGAAGKTCTN